MKRYLIETAESLALRLARFNCANSGELRDFAYKARNILIMLSALGRTMQCLQGMVGNITEDMAEEVERIFILQVRLTTEVNKLGFSNGDELAAVSGDVLQLMDDCLAFEKLLLEEMSMGAEPLPVLH